MTIALYYSDCYVLNALKDFSGLFDVNFLNRKTTIGLSLNCPYV